MPNSVLILKSIRNFVVGGLFTELKYCTFSPRQFPRTEPSLCHVDSRSVRCVRSTSLWKALIYTSPHHQQQPDSGDEQAR
jgi:hypothetical protein